ncbi:hypothetical protein [Tatumella sp. UCD-D_suzukii]|uniref:hypothetical protein n=1 Tax=Tatumella sp. UCD-D_suzukii TaxID=1408192 RepID=UPI00046EAB0B|nr:hypothetical protein [Tatumella sp. UCD-D_suzukii]
MSRINPVLLVNPSLPSGAIYCTHDSGFGHDEQYCSSTKKNGFKTYKNESDFFQSFVDAGRVGGLASKKRARFRLSLICRLVREVLYRQPLEVKLSASEVAYEIHDDFATEVRAHVETYGNESTFGARDKKIHMPFLELITREIRKQVKKGYELIKSKADKFYPAPGCVPA